MFARRERFHTLSCIKKNPESLIKTLRIQPIFTAFENTIMYTKFLMYGFTQIKEKTNTYNMTMSLEALTLSANS